MSLVPIPENLVLDDQKQDKSVIAQEKRQIKEWLQMQPHLPQELDDEWLEKALSACKHSVTRCKEKIDNYYTVRSILPDYFTITDKTMEEIKQQSSHIFSFFLPKWTPDGNRVFMSGKLDYKSDKYDAVAEIRRLLMIRDLFAKISEIWNAVIIFDATGSSFVHTKALVPHVRSLAVLFLQNSIARAKHIHIINVSPAVKVILNAIMPLIKEKMRSRFMIHSSDLSTFYNYVPQNILPAEYGGEAGSVKQLNDDWYALLESERDWLSEEYVKKSDESKRPKECPMNSMFGLDGSFKTLSID